MKTLTGVFAATLLSAIAAACTPHQEQAREFNPVRDHLETHGLMKLAQTEPQGKAICEFDQGVVEAALKAGDRKWFTEGNGRGLMLTFYMCNAVDAPGFGDNPYNDALKTPPAGKTTEQVKAEINQGLATQEAQLCANNAADARPDAFLTAFCATLQPSS
jgi:hypothetical protein